MFVGMFGAVATLLGLHGARGSPHFACRGLPGAWRAPRPSCGGRPGAHFTVIDLYGAHLTFIGLGGDRAGTKQKSNYKQATHGDLRNEHCTM
jgi:hypothetical protein